MSVLTGRLRQQARKITNADIADFLGGIARLCDERSIVTVENPTFIELMKGTQFDFYDVPATVNEASKEAVKWFNVNLAGKAETKI